MTSIAKQKFPRELAIAAARELSNLLQGFAHPNRFKVAGSLRRRKPMVGDVEIVFVPALDRVPDTLFETKLVSMMDAAINSLVRQGVLARRKNVNGSETWGQQNKLAVHVATGVPVDLFATTEDAWFNYLVCRTGGAESNTRIASAAQDKGWKWNPYGPGFTDNHGAIVPVRSEQDVFRLAGLKYLEPWER